MNIPDKWLDAAYEPTLKVQQIDPHNLDVIRGELDGVTSISMTDGYYSDTQISASISTIADNYIGGSWIRCLVDNVPVFTLGVQSVKTKQAPESATEKDYALQSVIWMIASNIAYSLYTIKQGSSAKGVISTIANLVEKKVLFASDCKDYTYGAAKAFERTDSYASIINSICNSSGNMLTADGYGRLYIVPYIAPANKGVTWTLDADDTHGIIIDPGYEDSDSSGDAYDKTVVIATNSDKKTIVGTAQVSDSSTISPSYRGWSRINVHQESEMSPFTQARANTLAKTYAPDDQSKGLSRNCTCLYWPVKSGDIIEWIQNGSKKKYLAQTIDADFQNWTVKLTLKEV